MEEKIGGRSSQYIRMKDVEQNLRGDKFACIYNDNGKWFIRTFGKVSRTDKQINDNELNVSSILKLNNHMMCTHTLPDPFGNCCFITDTQLYICVFHNWTLTHYHFVYDMEQRTLIGNISKM